MSIVRISHDKNNPYVMLNKGALEDNCLSWAAKGLWAYLMSRPDNWNISVAQLSTIYNVTNDSGEREKGGGESAIYALLNELIDNGYCIREKLQSEKGQFKKTDYTILELKIKVPHRGSPHVDQPRLVKDPTNNKQGKINKEATEQQTPVADIVSSVAFVASYTGKQCLSPAARQKSYDFLVKAKCDHVIAQILSNEHSYEDILAASVYLKKQREKKKAKNEDIDNIWGYYRTILKNRYWDKK